HSIALRSDGTVVAWGYNDYGQTNIPPGLSGVVTVAGGAYHSLALRGDGTVTAWGDHYNGQTTVPASLNKVVAIAAGGYDNMALAQLPPMTTSQTLYGSANHDVLVWLSAYPNGDPVNYRIASLPAAG